MPYLIAAVVLLGLLSAVNLLLTLALARRLKETGPHGPHAAGAAHSAGPPVELGPGARPAGFTAVTTRDEPVSAETLTGLVGFFAADCDPCHALAPRFAEQARASGRDRLLAVVTGEDAELTAILEPAVRVIVEDFAGPVSEAFQNSWTPALYLIGPDHAVLATGGRLEDLPLEALA